MALSIANPLGYAKIRLQESGEGLGPSDGSDGDDGDDGDDGGDSDGYPSSRPPHRVHYKPAADRFSGSSADHRRDLNQSN